MYKPNADIMRIGVDFDNTIVCYDKVFFAAALEKGLISEDLPGSKNQVREFLRESGNGNAWTELQGYVYGARIAEADPYPGVFNFFQFCSQNNIPTFIISHKSRYPYLGPKYDLHDATHQWLVMKDFIHPDKLGLSKNSIFLELTKEKKLGRIAQLRCTHFIDDLPEFLTESNFPPGVKRILFDPDEIYLLENSLSRFSSWDTIEQYFNDQLSVIK